MGIEARCPCLAGQSRFRSSELRLAVSGIHRLPFYVVCLWHRFANKLSCFSKSFILFVARFHQSMLYQSLWNWSHGTGFEQSIPDLIFFTMFTECLTVCGEISAMAANVRRELKYSPWTWWQNLSDKICVEKNSNIFIAIQVITQKMNSK